MKRRICWNGSMLGRSVVVAAMALGMANVSFAANNCTLKSLRGTYVFAATGFNIVNGVAQPKAIVEFIDFKGDGTLSVPAASRSINGAVGRTPPGGVGTYTVEAGCTGTLAFTPGPGFDIFLSPNGGKLWMIQNDSGSVFQGTTESAADQPCGNETLKGAYGLQISGTRPAPFVIPGTAAFVGQVEQMTGIVIQVFDGEGNFTQVDNVKGSISGIVPDRPGRGTYTVGPDCSLSQVVRPPGQEPITSKGVVVDGGKEFRQNTITPAAFFITAVGRQIK